MQAIEKWRTEWYASVSRISELNHCWVSIGQPSNQQSLFVICCSTINFLANCRIVSDLTQTTRRNYCVKTQLVQRAALKTGPFCEFMQCQCSDKTLESYLFVRCNWNVREINPSMIPFDRLQIIKWLAFATLILHAWVHLLFH